MAEHLCPYWVGYFLASRLRTLLQNPARIVAPYVRPGMAVLDIGSAMGYFSLPMAAMVGPEGKVVCVDVQPRMLDALRRRARRAGLAERIETHVSTENAIGLHGWDNRFDFALAFMVLHEVGDPANFLRQIYQLLKPGAPLLLTEPTGHVSRPDFDRTITLAEEMGYVTASHPPIRFSYAVLLTKP
jgi:ubiquinone/menaquinone biosynthesis C-methylase UbiE